MQEWRTDEKGDVCFKEYYLSREDSHIFQVARLELTGYYKTYYNNEETRFADTAHNRVSSIMGVRLENMDCDAVI